MRRQQRRASGRLVVVVVEVELLLLLLLLADLAEQGTLLLTLARWGAFDGERGTAAGA